MSLYNMMFGFNTNAALLLKILGFSQKNIPRFRDCFINDDKIIIYTRTGGGNREYYENEETCKSNYPEDFEDSESPSGPWNDDLRKNPNYLFDEDDEGDSTYANFYFKFPEEFKEDLEKLSAGESFTPSEKWKLLFEAMDNLIKENQGKK